jgi:hypothetical protein
MRLYTCWITCMLESYQDQIVSRLVKKGYTVGLAATGKVILNHQNQVSAVLAFEIYKLSDENLSISKLYEDIAFIMSDIKGYFYSIIIAESRTYTWTGSNIFVPPKKETQLLSPPTEDDKKSKLN